MNTEAGEVAPLPAIEELVKWENTTNGKVLNQAREEILKAGELPAKKIRVSRKHRNS